MRWTWPMDPRVDPGILIPIGTLRWSCGTVPGDTTWTPRAGGHVPEPQGERGLPLRLRGGEGELFVSLEHKPNEGHAAMLLPTVPSAILFWKKLAEEYGISQRRKGVNKEFSHSEMIGLAPVLDMVEETDNGMLVHMHVNSQGYNDGMVMRGPRKFDVDHGCASTG